MKIRKAVIPAAGLGTRMLPATKTVPKEMLPLVNKPVLQFIVEEAVDSGIEEIVLITSKEKKTMDNHFLPDPELYERLMKKGAVREAEAIESAAHLAKFHFVEQKQQRGLGDAVYCAREHIGDEPFAVLLGDDIMKSAGRPVLRQLIDASEKYGCSSVACREVSDEGIGKYSSLAITPLEERIFHIHDMNEKPTPEEKLSNYAILGRYVLTGDIFDILERTPPGRNDEIQLTDAMRVLCRRERMVAVDFEGKRYDTGNPRDYISTFIDFALDSPGMGDWTREFILKKARELESGK